MIYIHTDKRTNQILLFGSLVALCNYTGLKKDRFYTHFGRNKETEFENSDFRILKTKLIRSTN